MHYYKNLKEDFMKKLITFVATLLLTGMVFAEQTPFKLFTGAYKFATEASDSWKIYDANFISVYPTTPRLYFTGAFVSKTIVGYTRYDFSCTVTKNEDDFSVELRNVTSVQSDKNGKTMFANNTKTAPKAVIAQYEKQMKEEIINRMNSLSDEECKNFFISYLMDEKNISNISFSDSSTENFANFLIENKFTEDDKYLTNPTLISYVALSSNNKLQFERYISKTGLIGKEISLSAFYSSIEKNTFLKTSKDYNVYLQTKAAIITFATNNDEYIDLKEGAKIEIKGIIDSINYDERTEILSIIVIDNK